MARRFVAVAVVLLAGAGPAAAGAPTDRLSAFFDRVNHVILAHDTDGGLEDRLAAVRGLVTEIVDFEGAAALALGRHWEGLAPAERAAFTRLYADIVERAYVSWIGGKARLGEDGISIRWLDERVDDATASVGSALLTRADGEVGVEYRMVRRGDAWLVRDVLVDGVSLAANYRVQFERVLQQGSYAGLVARMQEKAGPAARAYAAAVMAVPTPSTAADASTAVVVAAIRDEPGAVVSDVRPSAVNPPAAPAPLVPMPLAPAPAAAHVEPARVAPTPRSAPPRELWVQVGVFRTVEAAARLMQQLRRYAVMLAIGGERQAPRARVLVGPFADRSAAASTVRALHAGGLAAFITEAPH